MPGFGRMNNGIQGLFCVTAEQELLEGGRKVDQATAKRVITA